jgi:hypothetical protein
MANNPISPVSRASTFQHPAPSAAAPQTRVLDTSAPAINAQPVELDGMPTTPEELRRRGTAGSTGVGCSSGPADGEDIDAEFLGEGGKGAGQIGREVCLFYRLFLPLWIVDGKWKWAGLTLGIEACCDFGVAFERPRRHCRCAA